MTPSIDDEDYGPERYFAGRIVSVRPAASHVRSTSLRGSTRSAAATDVRSIGVLNRTVRGSLRETPVVTAAVNAARVSGTTAVGGVAVVVRITGKPVVDAALAGPGAHTAIPASRSSASAYFSRVRATTSAGSLGPGAVLSQSSVSR